MTKPLGCNPRLTLTLMILSLAGCAAAPSGEVGGDAAPPVLRQVSLPLGSVTGDQTRRFGDGQTQGRLDAQGGWTLRSEIAHRGLRCATYGVGVRVGRGGADCTQVQWFTEPSFAAPLTHCNSATRIHTGAGAFNLPEARLVSANCVGVVTRCTGACAALQSTGNR